MSEKYPRTPKKVLFVCKEKSNNRILISIQRQIDTLTENNPSVEVTKFFSKGSGIIGYHKICKELVLFLDQKDFDIIHAHYSFMGMITLIANRQNNVVVSFMGSDVFSKSLFLWFSRRFVLKRAKYIVVKSDRMLEKLPKQNNISVIPNGINIKLFQPLNKTNAKKQLEWNTNTIHILFPAGENRYEKNFPLAQEAITQLSKNHSVTLHLLEDVEPKDVPIYLNAADIILLTSRWEGSSNVTKEAMACNSIVVSTDVGDTRELFYKTQGYFLTTESSEDIVSKLENAITFLKKQNTPHGRRRILDLGLDDTSTIEKLLEVYKKILN